MKEVSIHRRSDEPSTPPGDFKRFDYPFSEFPSIVSHVHPRFVICNTGEKLKSFMVLIQFAEDADGPLYELLMTIMRIYAAWKKATPELGFYADKNESTALSGYVRNKRKANRDVHYAESSASPTSPTLPNAVNPPNPWLTELPASECSIIPPFLSQRRVGLTAQSQRTASSKTLMSPTPWTTLILCLGVLRIRWWV